MLNKVQLIGHLGRDAEVRYTQSGKPVASMSLATTEKWKDQQGQKQEKTEWHKLVLWGKLAESLKNYLVKGKQIYVEGQLQTRKWTDRDGHEKYTTEVNVRDVRLLGGGNGNGRSSSQSQDDALGGGDEEPMTPITDDDIPFGWLLPLLTAMGAAASAGTWVV